MGRTLEDQPDIAMLLDVAELLSPFEANLELRMAQAWKMVEELRGETARR